MNSTFDGQLEPKIKPIFFRFLTKRCVYVSIDLRLVLSAFLFVLVSTLHLLFPNPFEFIMTSIAVHYTHILLIVNVECVRACLGVNCASGNEKVSIVEKVVLCWCDTSGVDAPFSTTKEAAFRRRVWNKDTIVFILCHGTVWLILEIFRLCVCCDFA